MIKNVGNEQIKIEAIFVGKNNQDGEYKFEKNSDTYIRFYLEVWYKSVYMQREELIHGRYYISLLSGKDIDVQLESIDIVVESSNDEAGNDLLQLINQAEKLKKMEIIILFL